MRFDPIKMQKNVTGDVFCYSEMKKIERRSVGRGTAEVRRTEHPVARTLKRRWLRHGGGCELSLRSTKSFS